MEGISKARDKFTQTTQPANGNGRVWRIRNLPELTHDQIEADRLAEEKREAAEKSRRLGEALRRFQRDVGKRYAKVTLDSFACDHAGQQEAVDSLKKFAAEFSHSQGRNVIAAGPSGSGKDHLLVALTRELIKRRGASAQIVHGVDLFSRARDAMGGGESEAEIVGSMTHSDILLLSDPVPPVGPLTEYQAALLFQTLDRRYINCRSTFTTINVADSKEARERLGASLWDRLRHDALIINCDWPSYRKPGQVIGYRK